MQQGYWIAALMLFILADSEAHSETKTTTKHRTIDAFSVWQVEGQLVPVSTQKAVVAGTVGGPFYVETDEGPADIADVTCPMTLEIDLSSGNQSGAGYCTFTAHDHAKVFGSWRCHGAVAEGCDGDFTITGGTGRLASITGKSQISFYASRHDLHVNDQTALADKAGGITLWPELSVTLKQALQTH